MTASPIQAGLQTTDADEAVGGICPYLGTPDDASQQEVEWHPYTAVLEASPYKVQIGDLVNLVGNGYTPGATVEFVWYSVEGRYEVRDHTEFIGQRYSPTTDVVAVAVANAAGEVHASFVVPLDFGGPHDIRARVEGIEVAQGGVLLTPTWSISSVEGPVGADIEIHVIGIEYRLSINTWHILWDNHYFGMITGVTTRGVATARFRAAGPVGKHFIAIWNNSFQSTPYLAFFRSPFRDQIDVPVEFTYTVTADEGTPPTSKDDFSAADNPWPVETVGPATLRLSPDRCYIGDTVTLSGAQFPPNTEVDIYWRTAAGDRINVGGITEYQGKLGTVRTNAAGELAFDFAAPDDLGGSHRMEVKAGEDLLAATCLVIMPKLLSFTSKAKAGERINVHLHGTGWSTYENTYAVTWDNSYIGYACAFSTQGDMQFFFTATGAPGTHLLDLYPTIYKGADEMPKVYSLPQLSYAEDHPERKTPAFRLAVEITE